MAMALPVMSFASGATNSRRLPASTRSSSARFSLTRTEGLTDPDDVPAVPETDLFYAIKGSGVAESRRSPGDHWAEKGIACHRRGRE
jgi:hypothetical protein